jgi:antitoxin ParD1/3/4
MTTGNINVALPESMREFIDSRLESGGFSTASDYVRDLVHKDQAEQARAELRAMIIEGMNSSPAVEWTPGYSQALIAEIRAQRAQS